MTAIQDECGLVADTLTGGSGEGGEKRSESGRQEEKEKKSSVCGEKRGWRLAVGGWLRVGLMPRLNLFFYLLQLTEYMY